MQKTENPRNVQHVLEEELCKLKRLVPLDEELNVCWKPLSQAKISGEVRGNTIYVYDENLEEAVSTVRHEFIDYLISTKLVNPLVSLINVLIKANERQIYENKERIVDVFSRLIGALTEGEEP